MLENPEPALSRDGNQSHILDIKIKNFGPITEGRIGLKPLTILVGPNSSGKSYAAALVYSAARSETYFREMPEKLIKQAIKECKAAYKRGERGLNLSSGLVLEINKAMLKATRTRLERHLKNNFTPNLSSLVQIERDAASIEIRSKDTSIDIQLAEAEQIFTVQDYVSSIRVNLGNHEQPFVNLGG